MTTISCGINDKKVLFKTFFLSDGDNYIKKKKKLKKIFDKFKKNLYT